MTAEISKKAIAGTLYILATPIGNRQDITLRALEVLKQVDHIAAEDTRHTIQLLQYFSIKKPLISLHQFNETMRIQKILSLLKSGQNIALVSDAGTPLISDPGFCLVRAVQLAAFTVTPIPGPSAVIAALSVAGLPTDRFSFEGFLPIQKKACETRLKQLQHDPRTLVFYEAPHRLLKTLRALKTTFGEEQEIVIAKELTKKYETLSRLSLKDAVDHYTSLTPRGEYVLLLSNKTVADIAQTTQTISSERILSILLAALPLKQAVHLTSQITNERKNTLYKKALMRE